MRTQIRSARPHLVHRLAIGGNIKGSCVGIPFPAHPNLGPTVELAPVGFFLKGSVMTNLTEALTRLAHYRSRYNDGDLVDEASGLTAADLDVVIAMAPALALDLQGKPVINGESSQG